MTAEEKYQPGLMNAEGRDEVLNTFQVSSTMPGKEGRTGKFWNTHDDWYFYFSKDERVYTKQTGCEIGVVQENCDTERLVCVVVSHGGNATVSLADMSPADADWPTNLVVFDTN